MILANILPRDTMQNGPENYLFMFVLHFIHGKQYGVLNIFKECIIFMIGRKQKSFTCILNKEHVII